jgi:hypothetical protein
MRLYPIILFGEVLAFLPICSAVLMYKEIGGGCQNRSQGISKNGDHLPFDN